MKKLIVALVILALSVLGFAVYNNYEDILMYITNKDWQVAESIGTVNVSNFYSVDGTSSNLLVVGNNYITGYSNTSKQTFDEAISVKGVVTASEGDYCIIGETDGTKLYMINGSKKVWSSEIQGTILGVSVNKNGYSAVIYKQAGYKSLVNNVNQENVKKVDLGDDVLVVDVKFNDKNQIVVQTDSDIKIIENGQLNSFLSFKDLNVNIATIKNDNNAIYISKVDNGLFDSKYVLTICDYKDGGANKKEYEMKSLPSMMVTQKKNIVLLVENELLVVNSNGKLVKRVESVGNIKSIVMFDNGNSFGLVYRDKIEFLKI